MKKVIYLFISLVALASCGDDKSAEEIVKLDDFKDRISYALGAEQAKMILQSPNPNKDRHDVADIVEGFNEGIKSANAFDKDCEATIQKLFGPYGEDFDTTYLKAGSICIGKSVGSIFYSGLKKKDALSQVDMEMAKIGFKHALEKRDTLIKLEERNKMLMDFITDINAKSSSKMMASAKKLPNTRTLPEGIIIQTIQEGTGGSPTATDDVKADYILMSAEGDTIESSFQYKQQQQGEIPAFNLTETIPGWIKSFQTLKKGGKYKLFVPADLAYGPQKGALCFYIEFIDFGKAGSLAKPRPQQPVQ